MAQRYTLTQPKTKSGIASYFFLLNRMYDGEQISNYSRFNMTTQALRERGLIEAKNRKGYVITSKGEMYVEYVRSTNKPMKALLIQILDFNDDCGAK